MGDLGYAALVAGFVIAVYGAVAWLLGHRNGQRELLDSARNSVWAVAALNVLAAGVLINALVTHDFQFKYVYSYTSSDMDVGYILSAFWAGNEGSLLLWAVVLSLFGLVAMLQNRRQNQELLPYAMAIVLGVEAFFLFIVAFQSSPFARFDAIPVEGQGLNPLLENPGMFFHPPTLYLGYVGFTIPFAFAMAALISKRLGPEWINSTRRWTLVAWFFLSMGNLLGAQWAYVELGWGGYWGWDPVENASLLPWLVGTAYLHSVKIQQRRGMLKVWNMALIILTFSLTIFGTFLTRSGVIQSVHAFGDSTLGAMFLGLLAIVVVSSVGLLISRLTQLKSESELDSLVSRESSFLFNNLILVAVAFAVFWGTVFPLISEAVRGVTVSVGAPFYNVVAGPIFGLLILLMGICALIGWRRASTKNLIRNFLYPAAASLAIVVLLYAMGMREIYALVGFTTCGFVAGTIGLEWVRGVRARSRKNKENYLKAFFALVWNNKPRYGGYVVHVGIVLIALGVIGSMMFKEENQATLGPGESVSIRDYSLTLDGVTEYSTQSKNVTSASFSIARDGSPVGKLVSEKYIHKTYESPVTEVGIWTTPKEDLYVILAGWGDDGTATIKAVVNPLVVWIWIGGVVVLFGTLIAVWPDAREQRRAAALREEASRAP